MTAVVAGSKPMLAAACRKRSGAGLPRATSPALKMRPSKRSHSPVVRSVKAILWCGPLDATHDGSAIRSSAALTPGTARSSRAKIAPASA